MWRGGIARVLLACLGGLVVAGHDSVQLLLGLCVFSGIKWSAGRLERGRVADFRRDTDLLPDDCQLLEQQWMDE